MRQLSFISNFRKNIICGFGLLIFSLIIIFSLYIVGRVYYSASAQNKINVFSQHRFEDFYNSKNLDLIFVGSSHSYCTFDPEIFNTKLDLNSYQLGMPGQTPDSTYYTLLEILNYQKPKVIVMELFYLMLSTDFDVKQFDQLFKFLDNNELKDDYIKNVFAPKDKVKYYIPTIHYQTDYYNFKNAQIKKYLEEKFGLKLDIKQDIGVEKYRSLGYVYCDYVMDDEVINDTKKTFSGDGKKYEFSEKQIEYLKKIVDLCNKNDIRLLFVTAPISPAAYGNFDNYNNMFEKFSELANSLNVDYIDYNILNEKVNFVTNSNFRDSSHLNHSGVEIISSNYADYLKDIIK